MPIRENCSSISNLQFMPCPEEREGKKHLKVARKLKERCEDIISMHGNKSLAGVRQNKGHYLLPEEGEWNIVEHRIYRSMPSIMYPERLHFLEMSKKQAA